MFVHRTHNDIMFKLFLNESGTKFVIALLRVYCEN